MKIKLMFLLLASMLIMQACIEYPVEAVGEVEGYRPMYVQDMVYNVEFLASQEMVNPGKIYVYGNLLFNKLQYT